jgi:ubiquinone/menaquinone biosynthesis C-methylase UbiE
MWQKIKDFILFPLRVFFEHDTVEKLGLTSLRQERMNVCIPYLGKRVLDIGCGKGNKFIKKIGYGIGLDPIFDCDCKMKVENINFKNESFDTITMMGTLRYIKNKDKALKQIYRVLDKNGKLLILENNPKMNKLRHSLIWWNPYDKMEESEMSNKNIINLLDKHGFKPYKKVRYLYKLSIMYVFVKNN